MREIKFRALSGENGEWEYFYLFNETDVRKLSERIQKGWIKGLSQFTSLLDKNGREIYEGDIVQMIDREPDIIAYCDKCKSFEPFFLQGTCQNCEDYSNWEEFKNNVNAGYYQVVGNIYENNEK